MEKLYNDIEYSNKAIEANNEEEALYVYVHTIDYDVEVLEWDEEERQEERQVIDEEGNPVYDEEGNPVMETVTVTVTVPRMVEETIEVQKTEIVQVPVTDEEGNPVYDEEGNPVYRDEEVPVYDEQGNPVMIEVTIEVQAHHTETRQKEVAELLIAPTGYYVCYDENYTDGTINPNYEEEVAQKERQRIMKLSMTKLDLVTYLEPLGITYTQIKGMLAQSEEAQKEWELCERVYRFNTMLNTMATAVGISSEQLDYIFQVANGEDVEPPAAG